MVIRSTHDETAVENCVDPRRSAPYEFIVYCAHMFLKSYLLLEDFLLKIKIPVFCSSLGLRRLSSPALTNCSRQNRYYHIGVA